MQSTFDAAIEVYNRCERLRPWMNSTSLEAVRYHQAIHFYAMQPDWRKAYEWLEPIYGADFAWELTGLWQCLELLPADRREALEATTWANIEDGLAEARALRDEQAQKGDVTAKLNILADRWREEAI